MEGQGWPSDLRPGPALLQAGLLSFPLVCAQRLHWVLISGREWSPSYKVTAAAREYSRVQDGASAFWLGAWCLANSVPTAPPLGTLRPSAPPIRWPDGSSPWPVHRREVGRPVKTRGDPERGAGAGLGPAERSGRGGQEGEPESASQPPAGGGARAAPSGRAPALRCSRARGEAGRPARRQRRRQRRQSAR